MKRAPIFRELINFFWCACFLLRSAYCLSSLAQKSGEGLVVVVKLLLALSWQPPVTTYCLDIVNILEGMNVPSKAERQFGDTSRSVFCVGPHNYQSRWMALEGTKVAWMLCKWLS
jgi:hypothetical protein